MCVCTGYLFWFVFTLRYNYLVIPLTTNNTHTVCTSSLFESTDKELQIKNCIQCRFKNFASGHFGIQVVLPAFPQDYCRNLIEITATHTNTQWPPSYEKKHKGRCKALVILPDTNEPCRNNPVNGRGIIGEDPKRGGCSQSNHCSQVSKSLLCSILLRAKNVWTISE